MTDFISSSERNDVISLLPEHDENGDVIATTTMCPSSSQKEKSIMCKSGPVVPVIFIPGIMGTNLINVRRGKPVWVAPNVDGVVPVFKAVGTILDSIVKSSKQRQLELDPTPSSVSVYYDGEIGAYNSGLSSEELHRRGWGAIMRSAYHPIMANIQYYMNHIMVNNEFQGWWKDKVNQQPSDWGDWEGNTPLSELDPANGLQNAADISYEVWAAGYNWLQSNKKSAEDIVRYIDDVVLPHYKGRAKKVLIVTHSMGGLVARAMIACHGFDKLYGIVHGAMPATGAPASYKRMRSGFEAFAEKQILGRHAADAVAVMAFAQGPLELLPSLDYNNGQPWLFVRDTTTGKRVLSFPKNDPYEEIYKAKNWWGLIPQSNYTLMDPGALISTDKEGGLDGVGATKETIYFQLIDEVKEFHSKIQAI
ncbi:MAG: alpha/beta hydrolase [Pseudomonas sp.]|nr:alpha/beta hydrolase [Pseudomonas sp.]